MLKYVVVFASLIFVKSASAFEINESDLAKLPPADIYILGEVHDVVIHHLRQAQIVEAIQPTALVFEMLTPEQAKLGQDAPRDDPDILAKSLDWDSSSWPEFEMYFQIFVEAPDARIYGAALPYQDVRDAIAASAAEVFGEDAEAYGLTQTLPPEQQKARETLQADAHCGALPADMLSGMVEAQRLRDAGFARTALDALRETGGPVAVIIGNGHAQHWGMPAAISAVAPDVQVLSLGQIFQERSAPPFDLWIFSEPPERDGDPCDAFKSK